MERTSRFVDINGPVHYVDYGGAGPAVVMLHGLGASHLNWDRIGPDLAADHHPFAIDLRGFGLTPLAGNNASLPSQVSLVAEFIADVAGGEAIVFGNSMGGTIAMLLAAEHPDLVSGLVLFGPGLPPQSLKMINTKNLIFLGLPLVPSLGEAAMDRYTRSSTPEERTDYLIDAMAVDPHRIDRATRQSLIEMARLRADMEWSSKAYCQALRSITSVLTRRSGFRDTLHRIATPTLIIHGTQDATVPLESAEWLAAERPDWEFARIADCGHVAHIELPQRSLDSYRDWSGRLAASPTA